MPTNKLIYFGVIVIAASALLWVGAELAKRVEWMLPYSAVAGALHTILYNNAEKTLISIALWLPYLLLSARVNVTFRQRVAA